MLRHVYSVVTAGCYFCWSTGQSLFKTIQSTFPHRRVWSVLARVSADSPCGSLRFVWTDSFWFSSFIFSTGTMSASELRGLDPSPVLPRSLRATPPRLLTGAPRVTQSDPASTPHWCSPGHSERPRLDSSLVLPGSLRATPPRLLTGAPWDATPSDLVSAEGSAYGYCRLYRRLLVYWRVYYTIC